MSPSMPKSKGATLLAVAVVVVILLAVGWTFPTWIVLLLVIVALFMCATICHGHFKKAREEGFSGWEICTLHRALSHLPPLPGECGGGGVGRRGAPGGVRGAAPGVPVAPADAAPHQVPALRPGAQAVAPLWSKGKNQATKVNRWSI